MNINIKILNIIMKTISGHQQTPRNTRIVGCVSLGAKFPVSFNHYAEQIFSPKIASQYRHRPSQGCDSLVIV